MATQDLATLYRKQGRLDEAEPLIVRTLDLSRRTLGEEDPQTLNAMGNLAALYVAQGRLQEAGRALRRILGTSPRGHG